MKRPNSKRAFEYEELFYLTCQSSRLSKPLAHYELYKRILPLPGAVVECGVFRGSSFLRFAAYHELLEPSFRRELIGFDTFGAFPAAKLEEDRAFRKRFVSLAGASISQRLLERALIQKGVRRDAVLMKGDITKTVPEFMRRHPKLRIALLNLDTDIYEPARTILKFLYPRIVPGGILILDDYGVVAGETKAVDEYFSGRPPRMQSFPFQPTLRYIVKPSA